MKDFNKLTDEKLRVEAAKALGWTEVCPCTENHWGEPWSGFEGRLRGLPGDVPDFPRDLNACREFEEALDHEAKWRYGKELRRLTGNLGPRGGEFEMNALGCFHLAHATARQRCLALLATLEPET